MDDEIHILIGTDCTEMFWAENERRAGRKEPYARETLLGWILLGPTEERRAFSANATTIEPLQATYERMLMADFEDIKCKDPLLSVDDKRALKIMQESVHISAGKFCVGIPWKIDPEEALQNNRSMAESRLRMLKRRFETNKKLAEDYTKTVETYISDGHAALVEETELNTVHQWYLPHHAVFKRSNPEKCRVVFDITNEQRHQQAVDMLQAYMDDGTRSEKSLHLKTLFSSGSSRASVASRKKVLSTKSLWWKSSIEGQERQSFE